MTAELKFVRGLHPPAWPNTPPLDGSYRLVNLIQGFALLRAALREIHVADLVIDRPSVERRYGDPAGNQANDKEECSHFKTISQLALLIEVSRGGLSLLRGKSALN